MIAVMEQAVSGQVEIDRRSKSANSAQVFVFILERLASCLIHHHAGVTCLFVCVLLEKTVGVVVNALQMCQLCAYVFYSLSLSQDQGR